ncbi:hypothetical protein KSP39_PZI000788 [Platanthera zijinensis]|uniref:Uncharacterized protein n=1 Tax=Platanthera zijinensis TaxID=2320716 RepID=A0AAP0C2B8_9ASPA
MDGIRGRWTEEQHSLFLNCIEASFVSQMFGGGRRFGRRIPAESATESTADSRRCSPDMVDLAIACCNRKRPLPRYDAPLDQVVPIFENGQDVDDSTSIKQKKRRGVI